MEVWFLVWQIHGVVLEPVWAELCPPPMSYVGILKPRDPGVWVPCRTGPGKGNSRATVRGDRCPSQKRSVLDAPRGNVRRPASESSENNCPLFSWLSGRFSRNPYSSGKGCHGAQFEKPRVGWCYLTCQSREAPTPPRGWGDPYLRDQGCLAAPRAPPGLELLGSRAVLAARAGLAGPTVLGSLAGPSGLAFPAFPGFLRDQDRGVRPALHPRMVASSPTGRPHQDRGVRSALHPWTQPPPHRQHFVGSGETHRRPMGLGDQLTATPRSPGPTAGIGASSHQWPV